tara:strand:+ start:139301 stop:140266 length:966 start_codon:yes stop_codon:yes gene_type:complete
MPDPHKEAPIILLGNVRSGTSMIQSFFGLDESVCTWFEPRTVWAYADPGRKHDRFTAQDATPKVANYIRKRLYNYAEEHQGRLMEKTPSNILRAPYVHQIFPESKLIYLIRHPLSQLSSSEFRWQNVLNKNQLKTRVKETPNSQLHYYAWRLFHDNFRKRILKKKHVSIWGVRYPGIYEDKKSLTLEQVIAKQWVEGSKTCRADLDEIDRVSPGTSFRIRYEDFVLDPRNHFAAMCDHVGLNVTQATLDEVQRRADNSSQDKWKRLDPKVIEDIRPIVAEEMKANGYEFPQDLPTEEDRQKILNRDNLSRGGAGSTQVRPN